VIGYRPHSLRHQLWYLTPAGRRGEVVITSADNGYAVDCDRDASDPHPTMQESDGEPWQSWIIESAPDGISHTIRSVHSRRYLAMADHAKEKWSPWFTSGKHGFTTEWVISQPIGAVKA
jgi:hypothetical protein